MGKDIFRRHRDFSVRPITDKERTLMAWYQAAEEYALPLVESELADKGISPSPFNFVYEDTRDNLIWTHTRHFFEKFPFEQWVLDNKDYVSKYIKDSHARLAERKKQISR